MTARYKIELLDDIAAELRNLRMELERLSRPASEVIMDDVELQERLHVSKRTTAYWREKGLITFSKLGGKIFYRLSDVLEMVASQRIPATNSVLKIPK